MIDSVSVEALTTALVERGAIERNSQAPSLTSSTERPWFVSALLGAAGWLAGIFVLIFASALFEPSGASSYAAFAAVLLPAAFGLYAADRHSAFFDQLALALSIAGQIAATAAMMKVTHNEVAIAGAVAIMQGMLVLLMPNRLARSIAAFFACMAWALAIRFAWWGETTVRMAVASGPAVAGWFVIWLPIGAIVVAAIASEPRWMARKARILVRPALGGMLLALTFGTLVSTPLDTLELLWDPASKPRTNWLVLWPLLNVGAVLAAGACAFRLRSRALIGGAVVVGLLHVMHFYYLLGTTLVVKSTIMLIVGAVLLGCDAVLRKRHGEGAPDP